ncbi:SpoIID/LytB domain-containing protein [Nocardioides sambongensis]|uniref:SpoIID/LytB domain-containing protein n=1 Tax=Nocardioides sambongensis TaxID=2589074 RepID=UPI0015E83AEF|nr:SpoIID/LytB domain-containing protein [Nocardioides sambongensis]
MRSLLLPIATLFALVLTALPGAPVQAATADPAGPAAAGAGVAMAVDDPPARRPVGRASALTLQGRGYGHGHGLSQYGAQGAASQHGRSYRQILSFYYPGLRLGRAGGSIRVLITADTTDDVVVRHAAGLRFRQVAGGRTWKLGRAGAERWRITAVGGRSRLSVLDGGWHTVRTVRGEAEFASSGKPLRLVTPSGTRAYAGALRSSIVAGGRATVNVLSMEAYLRGVVPLEVPALWHPQAVRSQAVAARTYAAFERASNAKDAYHLCDTSSCQVYGGVGQSHPASDRAIRATRRQVLRTKGGALAFTQFSASNGGWTTKGSFGYLRARQDPWDRWSGNPYRSWKHGLAAGAIENVYPGIGDYRRVRIVKRDGNGAWGGRVVSIRVIGSAGSTTVSGDAFRIAFGLRSTWFRVA